LSKIVIVSTTQFDSELRNIIAKAHCPMPFWASGQNGKGHPLAARLLFVGFNPSSAPNKPWLSYWDAKTGFDMAQYQQDHPRISKTRKNIYRIVAATIGPGVPYVNTNVYWTDSPRRRMLRSLIPGELNWLLGWVPKDVIIVAHGKKARDMLKSRSVVPFYPSVGFGIEGWNTLWA
jgi:hypothetical protein